MLRRISSRHPDFNPKDYLRGNDGRYYEISGDYIRVQLEQRTNSPEKQRDLDIAREILEDKLSRLTEKQREVLYLEMAGLPKKKIAKELGIKVSSVVTHLKAAKKKLAKQIQDRRTLIQEESNEEN